MEAILNLWFFSLQEQEGATLLVSAKFSIVSARNIYLQFEEASSLSSKRRICFLGTRGVAASTVLPYFVRQPKGHLELFPIKILGGVSYTWHCFEPFSSLAHFAFPEVSNPPAIFFLCFCHLRSHHFLPLVEAMCPLHYKTR